MSNLTTYTLRELLALKPPSWFIEGVIPEQGLIALYGAPGDGKSFVALDMALSVAAGIPWQGHPVQKGYVVYISAEGGSGIGKRVGAWLEHHEFCPRDYDYVLANFVVSAIRIHPDAEDLNDVLSATVNHPEYQEALADALEPDETHPPLFIVVDTLARCFEGDENKQEDMGNFIRGLDDLRMMHDATVLVVHHTGKSGLEERGSSAFRGACDAMMLVEKADTTVSISCTKQKDYEAFSQIDLELSIISKWGSCVLEPVAAAEARNYQQKLQLVEEYVLSHPTDSFREIAIALGTPKTTIYRMIQQISEKIDK